MLGGIKNFIKNSKLIRAIVPWIVIGVVGWFFYRTLASNWDKIGDISLSLNIGVVLGVVAFTLAVVVSGGLWGRMLGSLEGKNVSTIDAVRIHAASWLLKYVPGQVGSYLNKLAWGVKNGFSKRTISTSFLYENILMVVAGAVLSTPVLLLFTDKFGADIGVFIPLLMILPMLFVFSSKLFRWLLNLVTKVVKRKPFRESDFLSPGNVVRFQIGYLLPRLFNGVGFVLIVAAMLPVEPHMYVGLAATYILAGIVGLLALFVPGGIGVREAVIVLFLSVYFPVEQAIIVSLVARFYATISDIGVALVYLVLNKGRIRQL